MRLSIRTSAFAGVILSLAAAACGGGDDGDDGTGGSIDPNGTNHTYAISEIRLPSNSADATKYGLDIDGKANDGNGIDNSLGGLLASIGAVAQGLDIQASLDEQIAQGDLVLLANVKATDLASASGVGLWVYLGSPTTPPTPSPCADANDTVCGRHLEGTGMFTPDALENPDSLSADQKLAGDIVTNKFVGGPGNVTLQISLAGGSPISLPMKKARAEISNLTADGWAGEGSKIGGAISNDDITQHLMPAIADTVRTSFDESCTDLEADGCGCSGTGATLQGLFDDSPEDCVITDDEVISFVDPLLMRDIDLNGDGANDAVSMGVGVTGVKGSFTVPEL